MASAELEHRAQQRVGTALRGKYRLERVLGIGGMGAVYLATDTTDASRVAIKMLHREVSLDEGVRARFLQEAYVANRIAHPGIVRVLDDGVGEDGAVFLVEELVEGETLEERLDREGKLEPDEVIHAAVGILDCLSAAHACGIVHRDVKPANVLVSPDGEVRVLDFGLARVEHAPNADAPPASDARAPVLGSPAFMAPEQASGASSRVGPWSDVWAVGATMFTLLTGRFVHDEPTLELLLAAATTKPARRIETIDRSLSPALAGAINRALAFEARDRWPTAAAMRDALGAIARSPRPPPR